MYFIPSSPCLMVLRRFCWLHLRFFVSDASRAKCIPAMAGPIVIGAKADVALFVSLLVIPAKRLAPRFRPAFIKAHPGNSLRAASIRFIAAPLPWFGITSTEYPAPQTRCGRNIKTRSCVSPSWGSHILHRSGGSLAISAN